LYIGVGKAGGSFAFLATWKCLVLVRLVKKQSRWIPNTIRDPSDSLEPDERVFYTGLWK
jgi:hypothetical protein